MFQESTNRLFIVRKENTTDERVVPPCLTVVLCTEILHRKTDQIALWECASELSLFIKVLLVASYCWHPVVIRAAKVVLATQTMWSHVAYGKLYWKVFNAAGSNSCTCKARVTNIESVGAASNLFRISCYMSVTCQCQRKITSSLVTQISKQFFCCG